MILCFNERRDFFIQPDGALHSTHKTHVSRDIENRIKINDGKPRPYNLFTFILAFIIVFMVFNSQTNTHTQINANARFRGEEFLDENNVEASNVDRTAILLDCGWNYSNLINCTSIITSDAKCVINCLIKVRLQIFYGLLAACKELE